MVMQPDSSGTNARSNDQEVGPESPSSAARLAVGSLALALGIGLGFASTADAQSRGYGYGGGTPDYHEVNEGDTLYDLSGQYFGDTQQWPKMWSYNPHITNPHWIYPGDIIYLNPQPDEDEQQADQDQADTDAAPKVNTAKEIQSGQRFSVGGFVAKDDPQFVGRIVDSPKEARLLGQYDSCWVGFGEDAYTDRGREKTRDKNIVDIEDPGEIKKKQRYAIVTDEGPVTDAEGEEIGTKYLVIGSLVITKTSEKKLETAYIDQSWREIERGALLIPYERQLKLVRHIPAEKDMVGKIVDSVTGHFDFGASHYVFIDKGASDGVRPGNRFFIYQRRTGLPKRWKDETPKEIPWLRAGRIRIIDTTEEFSTGVIVKSKREISPGDRLEMYQGN